MIRFLRSLIFHIAYFGWNAFVPILLFWVPALPRRFALAVTHGYEHGLCFLERAIMDLDYVIEGLEHVPAAGSYIIAAKHQSVWETLKLHITFGDPAVIYKKELNNVPIWGWYISRLENIAVDRGARTKALSSMLKGAEHVVKDGRPIVIFPQGTRVAPGVRHPYRYGLAFLYKHLQIPVLPVAMNSGVFWGKNQFLKRSGTVTVRILPLIPAGLQPQEMMARVENQVEAESDALVQAVGGPALPPPEADTAEQVA